MRIARNKEVTQRMRKNSCLQIRSIKVRDILSGLCAPIIMVMLRSDKLRICGKSSRLKYVGEPGVGTGAGGTQQLDKVAAADVLDTKIESESLSAFRSRF